MDSITLPFRFIPDGEDLPDLADLHDPIVIRVRLEPPQAEPRAERENA